MLYCRALCYCIIEPSYSDSQQPLAFRCSLYPSPPPPPPPLLLSFPSSSPLLPRASMYARPIVCLCLRCATTTTTRRRRCAIHAYTYIDSQSRTAWWTRRAGRGNQNGYASRADTYSDVYPRAVETTCIKGRSAARALSREND